MTPTELDRSNEIPSVSLTLDAEHSVGFPGEVMRIAISGAGLASLEGRLKLQLVDQMGESVVEVPVTSPAMKLAIPATVKPDEYALRVSTDAWHLDSVPFEVMQRREAEMTRNILLASVRQAEAFDLLASANPDVQEAFRVADEAEQLYVDGGEVELARQIWIEIVDVLKDLGMEREANEAAIRNARINLSQDKAAHVYAKSAGAYRVRHATNALEARLRIYEAHLAGYERFGRVLTSAPGVLRRINQSAQLPFTVNTRARGSFAWGIQRLSADILSGLLTDLVMYRMQGLPGSTMASLDSALTRSTMTLSQLYDPHDSVAGVHTSFETFAHTLRAWAEIQGQQSGDAERRDEVWSELREMRMRLARRIRRLRWDRVVREYPALAPSAVTVIHPYVELISTDSPLVETAVAVVRIASRVATAAATQPSRIA